MLWYTHRVYSLLCSCTLGPDVGIAHDRSPSLPTVRTTTTTHRMPRFANCTWTVWIALPMMRILASLAAAVLLFCYAPFHWHRHPTRPVVVVFSYPPRLGLGRCLGHPVALRSEHCRDRGRALTCPRPVTVTAPRTLQLPLPLTLRFRNSNPTAFTPYLQLRADRVCSPDPQFRFRAILPRTRPIFDLLVGGPDSSHVHTWFSRANLSLIRCSFPTDISVLPARCPSSRPSRLPPSHTVLLRSVPV